MPNPKCQCASATAKYVETLALAESYSSGKNKKTREAAKNKQVQERLSQAVGASLDSLGTACQVNLSRPKEKLIQIEKIIKEEPYKTLDPVDIQEIDNIYWEMEKEVWEQTHGQK